MPSPDPTPADLNAMNILVTPERLAEAIYEHPMIRPLTLGKEPWKALAAGDREALVERARKVLEELMR